VTVRARRTRFVLFRCADRARVDVEALLRGKARLELEPELAAVSILRGEEQPVTRAELDLLLSLPVDRFVEVEDERVVSLAERGLLVLEEGDGLAGELRARDEAARAAEWNLYGCLYHSLTRWQGVHVELGLPGTGEEPLLGAAADEFVAEFGPPPPHFHELEAPRAVHELPLVRREGGLYEALARRRTSRVFDRTRPVTEEQLAVLLRETFGAHGYAEIVEGVYGLRRTSPSGGGLHPVEAYPLVVDVPGVEAGLYHYAAGRHALELVEPLAAEDARDLAVRLACGQEWFRDASVHVVLAARFTRSFWKYRRHEKAYAVVLMDAAHLSQTFALVCAELGLGSFVTAAVNGADADARLGLDGFAEGTLAVCGCGGLVEESSYLQPEFKPYVPRETIL
jgi:putative peptide maturation dehydrogenase